MSDSDVVSNFEITQIVDESANHDFFKFRFNINSGGESVKIRFSGNNNCTGILFYLVNIMILWQLLVKKQRRLVFVKKTVI